MGTHPIFESDFDCLTEMVFASIDQALQNATPTLFQKKKPREEKASDWDDSVRDPWDAREVFEMIREIRDPEHPMSLEELGVVQEELITVRDEKNEIDLTFTPTIPHCSMATLIGLSISVKLIRSLPKRFKVNLSITPGTHAQEHQVNRQLRETKNASLLPLRILI